MEFADEPLARYHVHYRPDRQDLQAVAEPQLFETPFRSAQLPLWEVGDCEWLKVIRRPDYAPRRPRRSAPQHAALAM